MDKREKQVRKIPECEECKEQDKMVESVIRSIAENQEKEPKKRPLFDFFESISKYHTSTITVKIDITWPKDMRDI